MPFTASAFAAGEMNPQTFQEQMIYAFQHRLRNSSPTYFLQELPRVHRPLRRFLVFEVGEDIAPGAEVLALARDHCLTLFGRVSRLAITVVTEVGGHDIRGVSLLGFGHA